MEKEKIDQIKKLQKEKDVVILAHYYVDGDMQEIADYVGDSFYLSKIATNVPQQTILFAGVGFMGESAKLVEIEKDSVNGGRVRGLSDGTYGDKGADCRGARAV